MAEDNINLPVKSEPARTRKRSLLCNVVLYSGLTYFLILAFLFLAGLTYSGKIIQSVSLYYNPEEISSSLIFWVIVTGSFLYLASSAGIFLFILNRKGGYYLFIAAAIVIFILDLYFLEFDWLRYLIHTGYIFILGIAHFSRKCYH